MATHSQAIATRKSLGVHLLEALENERALDLHYRRSLADASVATGLPNYKVMKLIAVRRRLGFLFRPGLALAGVAIVVAAPLRWLAALATALLGAPREAEPGCHVVATIPANVGLIESALARSGCGDGNAAACRTLRPAATIRRIGAAGVFEAISGHMALLTLIAGRPGLRRDLLLHSRDAFAMALLYAYARRRPGHRFATDDHYQRWSFLLSHASPRLEIVQHGFLDGSIDFAHRFGRVAHLHVRDDSFVRLFRAHFEVERWSTFAPDRTLAQGAFPGAVLVASSFPSIDVEIAFVRELKARSGTPVVVKFHPAHAYDGRKAVLAALADAVHEGDAYPACAVFVSDQSFMEYDYRTLSIPTVSIARAGGASRAAAEALSLHPNAEPARRADATAA